MFSIMTKAQQKDEADFSFTEEGPETLCPHSFSRTNEYQKTHMKQQFKILYKDSARQTKLLEWKQQIDVMSQ